MAEPTSGELTPDALTSDVLAESQAGEALLGRYRDSLLGVFGTPQRVLVRGSGATVWDAEGREYLDLLAGIAVNALGHAHPLVTSVVASQSATLGHISNFFTSPTQIALAEKLLQLSEAPEDSKVFFTNSGTESNEAAFKLARRHGGTDRPRIIALQDGFHGRSMGALALTWKPAHREPFEPLPGGVEWVPAGDVAALRAAVDETVAAVVVEPIQGEAGVRGMPEGYLQAVREITREAGALMIVDEVQTGVGRTGAWFASTGVEPDAMTLAKGLGGGFPIGALITCGEAVSELLSAGQHGTTFGGNPVATAAALATIHALESGGVLENVRRVGAATAEALAARAEVTEVRAHGLLIGFDVDDAGLPSSAPLAPAMVAQALEAGFIINAPGPRTLRLAPPLTITEDQMMRFVEALPGIHRAAKENA
ncbi:acetylornithine transaminase [Nesterenkonia sp. HG001]|uniref:acetylornithine transaminase n=1 Tax=Nesterenkonia sp. HG001 TaxID=2983207 RepID=UPI002AC57D90|nr:acetylornithine transaminase [Nesterenkonia sp. HG001]MDZ5078826.1 acetylornithine transaminase [Nesterenkonia sp. HG001]